MSEITAKDVKALRDRTGAGMMDCKKALAEAGRRHREGDRAACGSRAGRGRQARRARGHRGHGPVLHPRHGKIGVLVEVDCKTDFVARNEDFVGFARDIAMQIAADAAACTSPRRMSAEDVERGDAHRRAAGRRQAGERAPEHRRGQARHVARGVVLLEPGARNPKYDGKTIEQLRAELAARPARTW